MRFALSLLAVLLVLVAALAVNRPEPRAELTTGYISIETLDPQIMRAAVDVRIAYALFEGLLTYDPYEFTVRPGVAESWEVSDDGRTYTFHLRPDARWSDGSPLTARDFIVAWRQGLMPDIAPPYVDFLMHFQGAREFADWCAESLQQVRQAPFNRQYTMARERLEQAPAKFDELVGVHAADDHTLIVTLDKPVAYFLDLVASWPLFPLPAHVIEAHSRLDSHTRMLRRDPQWIKPANIVSNGPYKLAQLRFKRDILLEANPYYHDAQSVRSKTVRFVCFTTNLAWFNAYQSGAQDMMVGGEALEFMPDLIDAANAGKRSDVHPFDAYGTYYFGFNCRTTLPDGRPNPFADVRVRHAFAMTIDKQQIVENVTRMRQSIAGTFVPPGSIPGYPDVEPIRSISDARDEAERREMIARARELLDEAGYAGGTVELTYNTGGGHERVAQALAAMWQQHLSVNIKLDAQEWKVYLRRRNTGNFMIARSGWFGDYGDPTTFLELFQSQNGNNDTGIADPHYDDLLAQAARELDPAKRMAILAEAERYILHEQTPILPLYRYNIVHLYDPARISGVSHHPRNLQMYHLIKVDRSTGQSVDRFPVDQLTD